MLKEEILLLKIHNAIKEGKDFYEATRGHWRINKKRLNNIEYVAGINKGKVVCVFEPSKWGELEDGIEKGRKYFEGIEASREILSKLQSLEEKLLKKFGSGSSVAYISLSEID